LRSPPGSFRLADVKAWSWFLIGFATVLVGFAEWVRGNPYDIGGALGRMIGVLLIPLAVAYIVRGRRSKRNWDSFARWYFWLALILGALANAHPA
jgi:uncharacterized membrane protein